MEQSSNQPYLTFIQACRESVAIYSSRAKANHQDRSQSFCIHLSPESPESPQCVFVGIAGFDGHGPRGEIVAEIGLASMISHLEKKTIEYTRLSDEEIQRDITAAFAAAQERIKTVCHSGGSTCFITWAFVWEDGRDTTVYTANIGDSPVFTIEGDVTTQLTVDDSGTNPEENSRLRAFGENGMVAVWARQGINTFRNPHVFLPSGELNPVGGKELGLTPNTMDGDYPTYWVNPNFYTHNKCVAVSRSFGNQDAECLGMICEPHFTTRRVTPGSNVVIFGCTDGWKDIKKTDTIVGSVRSVLASSATAEEKAIALVTDGYATYENLFYPRNYVAASGEHVSLPPLTEEQKREVHSKWDDVTAGFMDCSKWPARAAVSAAVPAADAP